ncbi:unnamed protein product [Ascophyllum nodosum]
MIRTAFLFPVVPSWPFSPTLIAKIVPKKRTGVALKVEIVHDAVNNTGS